RRSIGVVFQDAKLLPVRTVYENVAFVLRVLGAPRREITERVFDALRIVGMSSRAQAYPAQLSQGEAQRAALARAIVRRPPLLLADEPTGNLDESMAAEILEAVKDAGSGDSRRRRRDLRRQGRSAAWAQAGARQGRGCRRSASGEPAARFARGDAGGRRRDPRGRARARRAAGGVARSRRGRRQRRLGRASLALATASHDDRARRRRRARLRGDP